jgi:hypothetical protein
MMQGKPGSRPPGSLQSGAHQMPGNGVGYELSARGPASNPDAPRGNALVFALIAILLVAIGVLAYLVLTK